MIIGEQVSITEQERQYNKVLLVKHAIGLFPGCPTETRQIADVLEIGCGSGAWTLEVAQLYPTMHIVGIDPNHALINQAQSTAERLQLGNVSHLPADVMGKFPCADASFDLISAQFLSKHLLKDAWPQLLQECLRVLRPGGWLRLTEYDVGISTSRSQEELTNLFLRAMYLTGKSFSDSSLGIIAQLQRLLKRTGVERRRLDHPITYSSSQNEEWKRDYLLLAHTFLRHFLQETGVAPQAYIDHLLQQLKLELNAPYFCAVFPMASFWVRKHPP
jgi:SAM-dependent methyltransferase